jgi:arabinose-5-phosphate isomerase
VLDSAVDKEACPLNLAPTASTTAQLALGDALAVALLDARGFSKADFARSHPRGTLYRQALKHVADVMRRATRSRPCARRQPLRKALGVMTRGSLGNGRDRRCAAAPERHLHRRRLAPQARHDSARAGTCGSTT